MLSATLILTDGYIVTNEIKGIRTRDTDAENLFIA
jgi:hypothetical protein